VVDESNADPCAEEIWPDKFGRVRVRFQWDVTARYACWLRVAQPWAGRGWGHQWVPRTGDEVLVDFVEGDPDCPIIVGSLYSPRNMPPFTLPDYKTRSGIVTRTSTKGTTHEFNMLRFEDKRGNEQVMIRSQRRMDVRVLASYYETTHANRHILTGLPKGTESGGAFNVTVGGEHNLHVKGDVYEGFDKKHNHTVKADVANDLQSNEATMVKAKYELNARQITIEALQQITLKAGSSFITLDLTGITIQAPMVKINCGGAATGCSPLDIYDPVDASVSDNGEPGYLEWLQSQRGSGGGHRHRTVNPQHGPNVTLEPNGNFRVNRGLVVDGSDPDFARKALNDVALIGTTPEGQRVLNNLDTSGRQTTISKRPPNPTDPLNAEAWPVDSAGNRGSNQAFIDSTPAGQPVFDGGGNPIPGPPAPQATGTGVGTDSNVLYDPDQWPAPGVTTAPSDTLLLHELGHSDNQTHGNFDGTPNTACFDTNEERNVITGPDNTYRSQRDVHTRTDHKDL
jgi:hypothetical protein